VKIALLVASLVVVASLPAQAGDGVLEINQACIREEGNCLPSSGAGFPIQLDAGSYRLTSNLVVPDANTDGIRMEDGTTLDLNGFSVIGPITCTGTPAACTGTGSGDGILVTGFNVTIRNGRVAGFARFGIRGDEGMRVENVTVEQNLEAGINSQGGGLQIVNCKALRNGGDGFYMAYQDGAVMLIGNTAVGNGDDGFDVANALLLDNTAHQNGDTGINAAYASTASALARNAGGSNGNGSAAKQVNGGYHFGPNVCGTVVCP
jgi:hypothetical protein